MRVRYFLFRTGYQLGTIVRYTGWPWGDAAEIAPDDGGPHCYLCRGAVEGYERLWAAPAAPTFTEATTRDTAHTMRRRRPHRGAMMNQAMAVLTSQATTEWYTPAWLIELARETMGGIDLDPASSAQAQETVRAGTFYTQAQDGYSKPWHGRVWLNPPFDETPRWVRRLSAAFVDDDVTQALLLVNSAPGYSWWESLWRVYPVCMLERRVAFISAAGVATGTAKKGTTIAYFGPYRSKFESVWSGYGKVLWP